MYNWRPGDEVDGSRGATEVLRVARAGRKQPVVAVVDIETFEEFVDWRERRRGETVGTGTEGGTGTMLRQQLANPVTFLQGGGFRAFELPEDRMIFGTGRTYHDVAMELASSIETLSQSVFRHDIRQ